MYCKFDHSEMIFGPFEKMTFLGEHPLPPTTGSNSNNDEKDEDEDDDLY